MDVLVRCPHCASQLIGKPCCSACSWITCGCKAVVDLTTMNHTHPDHFRADKPVTIPFAAVCKKES